MLSFIVNKKFMALHFLRTKILITRRRRKIDVKLRAKIDVLLSVRVV